MSNGPLDDPRLLAVEQALDRGRLEEAQALLADLDDLQLHRQGKSYLTTRLLYQRGRLSEAEVATRMGQVLRSIHDFPQAQALLAAAQDGTLSPDARTTQSAAPPTSPDPPDIPGPPALPNFHRSEPNLPSPSLAPPTAALEPRPMLDTEDDASAEGPDLDDAIALPFPQMTLPQVRTTGIPGIPQTPSDAPVTERDPTPAPAELDLDIEQLDTSSHRESSAESLPFRQPTIDQTPTLFSVLTLLDEHRYTEALMALNASSARNSPELTLMRARAQLGCGKRSEARDTLERLCESEPIGPELRAGCARLLLEAGEPELALEQAELAHADSRGSPAVLLTAAWATLRVARRLEDDSKRAQGVALLTKLEASGGPTPALASALWACVWAEGDAPKRALKAASHALELEPSSVDAIIAQCIAHARLGQLPEAAKAWRRLMTIDSEEALILRPQLTRLGAELERVSPSLVPTTAVPVSRRVWDPLEAALQSGEREALLAVWESECEEILAGHAVDSGEALSELGRLAAAALTRAPGFCHFAPYDLSLWSLFRLQVALDLIVGTEARSNSMCPQASHTLLGAYLGESIRHAYQGSWQGDLGRGDLLAVEVVTQNSSLNPFRQLEQRWQQGQPLELDSLLPLESAHSLLSQWTRRIPEEVAPPTPWSPDRWPSLQDIGTIGRALSGSVVGLYCSHFAGQELDHSLESLPALDSYLTHIAPPKCLPTPDSPSLLRAAVLAGSYAGEVVRRLSGGSWLAGDGTGPRAFALAVGELQLYPIEQLYLRTHGRTNSTSTEFVADVIAKLGL